jgi:hypothetical protein
MRGEVSGFAEGALEDSTEMKKGHRCHVKER